MRRLILFLFLIPVICFGQNRTDRDRTNPVVTDCAGYGFRGHWEPAAETYCAEALALFARMTTPPTTERKDEINTLIVGLKTDGLWSKLDVLYLFAAADEQAALLNWVSTDYDATNNGCTLTADSYYTGGTGKYINSNYIPSAGTNVALNSTSAGVYIYEMTTYNSGTALGVYAASSYLIFEDNANGIGTKLYGTNGSFAGGGTAQTTPMLSTLSRLSANLHKLYHGVDSLYATAVSVALPTESVYICAWNNAGTASGFHNGKISAFFVGAGLTRAEHLKFETRLEDYLVAVGLSIP